MSRHIPMITFGGHQITWEGAPPDEIINARDNLVSYDFIETMDMHIVNGRNFSRDFPSDKGRSCIINESAVRAFGWDNPIGKKIDDKYQVIGVVKDFHNNDMYNKIEPFYMVLIPDSVMNGGWSLAFRVDPNNAKKAREILKSELEGYFPSDPFEIRDYDESFTNQKILNIYKTIQNLVFFFTCLNILIAVVGLLGLVSFTTQRRIKEIGIRKINGSTNLSIFSMLSLEYLVLVTIASVIAWPSAYVLFSKLPGTYKHPFQIWPYFLATAAVTIIIFFTALYHTLKAANSNPVDALRYE
jgi:putative ABC transport system permease protein